MTMSINYSIIITLIILARHWTNSSPGIITIAITKMIITGKWHWTLGTKFVSSDRVLRRAFRWYLLFTSWSWWQWRWGQWWYWDEPWDDIYPDDTDDWLFTFPTSLDLSPDFSPVNLWQVNSDQFSTSPLIFHLIFTCLTKFHHITWFSRWILSRWYEAVPPLLWQASILVNLSCWEGTGDVFCNCMLTYVCHI